MNQIAILLVVIGLFYLFNKVHFSDFFDYRYLFIYAGAFSIAITVLKSASRSILLPIIALIFGSIVAASLSGHHTLWHLSRIYFEGLTLVGIVGIFISAVSID